MNTDPMWCYEQYDEAAQYIDKLEATNEMLRQQRDELLAALEKIADICNGYGDEAGWASRYAREAIAKCKEES